MKFYRLVLAVFIFLFTIPSYAFAHPDYSVPISGTCDPEHSPVIVGNSKLCRHTAPPPPPNAADSCGQIAFYKSSTEKERLTEIIAKKDFWVRLAINPALVNKGTFKEGDQYLFAYQFKDQKYFFDIATKTTKLEKKGSEYLLRGKFDIDNIPNPLTVYVISGKDKGTGPTLCSVPMGVNFGAPQSGDSRNNSCTPQEDNDCGTIDTAFGNFSGNPGKLAQKLFIVGVSVAGGVALIIMIFAGYKLITSRGNPDAIQSGRDLFTAAIIGLLVVIFAAFIIRIIGTTLKIPGISLIPTASAATFGGFPLNDPTKFANRSVADVFTDAIPIVFFFAGVLAFGFLIVGGFKYMISRGDQKALDSAKSTISSAIKGLVIIILSFLFLQIIQWVLKVKVVQIPNTAYADVNLGQALNTPVDTFGDLVSSLIKVALPLAGIVFFFLLLWGGIKYMLSRGDDKAVSSARGVITSALIGLLIIVGSFLIIKVMEGITNIRII